jgi:hypothetical protein
MNPQLPAVDRAVLAAAASIAEEALACHRAALVLLAEGWRSETGAAIKDFMEGECVHATDVVDALRRAAGGTHTTTDVWADSDGDQGPYRPTRLPDAAALPVDPAGPGPDRSSPAAPPMPTAPPQAPAPAGQFSPMSPIMPMPPITPTAAEAPWTAAGLPGGMPAPASFPDLGGTLVGLVAEIAQALGSYADTAPSFDPTSGTADPITDVLTGPDSTKSRAGGDAPPAALTDSTAQAGDSKAPGNAPADDATTGSATPAPAGTPQPPAPPEPLGPPQPPAPPELLAAERPPEPPEAAVDRVPVPDAVPVQPSPLSRPDEPPTAQSSGDPAEKTPCEIAADELPKVGE